MKILRTYHYHKMAKQLISLLLLLLLLLLILILILILLLLLLLLFLPPSLILLQLCVCDPAALVVLIDSIDDIEGILYLSCF